MDSSSNISKIFQYLFMKKKCQYYQNHQITRKKNDACLYKSCEFNDFHIVRILKV